MKIIFTLTVTVAGMLLLGVQNTHAKPKADCVGDNPVIIHVMGKNDQLPASADSLKIELIGNIKTGPGAGSAKMVKACNDTVMDYDAKSSASESVVCRLNGAVVPSKGRLRVSDSSQQRLMCTDKPNGDDVTVIRIMASK